MPIKNMDFIDSSTSIPCADEAFSQRVYEHLYARYGKTPDTKILDLVEFELGLVKLLELSGQFLVFHDLALFMKENHIPYVPALAEPASLLFFLLGITSANPLPPHYHCPSCHSFLWSKHSKDGFDLPVKQCTCGKPYDCDGHDMLILSFFGKALFNAEYRDVSCPTGIYISKSAWDEAKHFLATHPMLKSGKLTDYQHILYFDHISIGMSKDQLLYGKLPDRCDKLIESMPPSEIKQVLFRDLKDINKQIVAAWIKDKEEGGTDDDGRSPIPKNTWLGDDYSPDTFYGLIGGCFRAKVQPQ
ncbi:hypothetical protein LJC60_09350 [Ruminococcaceae bacterium OttesenSCG-928-D13]|nr:hypothetical protein [Ruminococcaceae bacterium OttesenSCG-928-D13]